MTTLPSGIKLEVPSERKALLSMSGTAAVVGAGVVGLACARALALRGLEVLVLEAEHMIGTGVSSRNSEVIHAGIYYPQGSLKAQACVEGRDMLYEYCAERGISHNRCGKLIVATSDDQVADLEKIKQFAFQNGVTDLEVLSKAEAQALEPNLSCVGALLSPSTGIVDSHSLMLALQGDIENEGGFVVFNTPVESIDVNETDGGHSLNIKCGGEEPMEMECDVIVNAAGLFAPEVAKHAGDPDAPKPFFAKGSYFKLEGTRSPFSKLIYPVPEKNTAGLGVHATIDLNGQTKFGPDVEWLSDISSAKEVNAETFIVDPSRCESFYAAIRKYWPALPDDCLVPDYSGIRFDSICFRLSYYLYVSCETT